MNPTNGPFAENLKALMALARYAHANEIAGLVSYLASPEAAFLVGSDFLTNGGGTAAYWFGELRASRTGN